MGRLSFATIASLDGYVADVRGDFQWGRPDDDVSAAVNEHERGVTTHLYGRRMYEVMTFWETVPLEDEPSPTRDFTLQWRQLDKVVFSRTLAAPSTNRTRLVRTLDPDEVRRWKATSPGDLSVAGATLAGQMLAHGLVDEVRLYLAPVAVGGGTAALQVGAATTLELVEVHRFPSGFVFLRYHVPPSAAASEV